MCVKRWLTLLFTAFVLLMMLSGCAITAGDVYDAAKQKLMDATGLTEIEAELNQIAAATPKVSAASGSKGTVDLSDGSSSEDDSVPNSGSAGDAGSASDDQQTSTGGIGGFWQKLTGIFSGGSSSSLNNFYIEIYGPSQLLAEEYGYSSSLISKVWYKDGKAKITSGSEDQYYTAASADAFFNNIFHMATLERAEEIIADQAYTKGDTVTINGFSCTEYDCNRLTDKTLDLYLTYVFPGKVYQEITGYERYFIYTDGDTPIIMSWAIVILSGEIQVSSGDIADGGGYSSSELHFTFNAVTDADVTPPGGTTTTNLG